MVLFEHKSVLPDETLDALNCSEGKVFLDCTTGGAGHSGKILSVIGATGYLYCIDKDFCAVSAAKKVLDKIGKNYKLVKYSYTDLSDFLKSSEVPLLDGILFDLGVSSYQLDEAGRGFSFSKEALLDMRFDQDDQQTETAGYFINNAKKDELEKVFSEYGEEPYSKIIAEKIVEERKKARIMTTTQLSNIVLLALSRKKYIGDIHPATRVFQAIRIKVNDELAGIRNTIPVAINQLKKGGRLAIISFHSLEDRIVKETLREAEKECLCPPRQPVCTCQKVKMGKVISKKPIVAGPEEIKANPRSRSAKLRVFERI